MKCLQGCTAQRRGLNVTVSFRWLSDICASGGEGVQRDSIRYALGGIRPAASALKFGSDACPDCFIVGPCSQKPDEIGGAFRSLF
jgi:hypothetical protein